MGKWASRWARKVSLPKNVLKEEKDIQTNDRDMSKGSFECKHIHQRSESASMSNKRDQLCYETPMLLKMESFQ